MVLLPEIAQAIELLGQLGATGDPQDPVAKTRARLLQAATRLFQSRGYRHTSVDEIAREAGVAKGTVYVHFKNKQELLLHAIAEEKKQFLVKFISMLDMDVPAAERLERHIELSFIAIQDAPLLSKLVAGDRDILMQLDEIGEELREQIQETQLNTVIAMARGIGGFDALSARERKQRAKVLVDLMVVACGLLDERYRGNLSVEVYARHLAKLIVGGVGAR